LSDFNTLFQRIYRTGIPPELSILDTIRRRILNVIIFVIMLLSGILIFYRIYLGDWEAAIVNSIVSSFSGFLFYLCTKEKHELALGLVSILIILLSLDLSRSGFHTSSIIYWALLPMGMALLFKNQLIKHLVFFICMLCFLLTTIDRNYDVNIYITFIGATSIYYLAMLNFVNFVERKQEEIDQVLKEKEKAFAALKARNDNLQQFSYICSHDFKEPLKNIGNFSSLIQERMSDQQSKEKYGEYFEFIDSSVVTLSNMINALQEFTDINGRNHFENKKIILRDLFNNSSKKLSGLIAEKNAEIIFKNESGQDFIYSSGYGLGLIIQNLIQNALKFNQSSQPKVTVTLENADENLLLKVRDNGIGVEEQYLRYIFEPFKTINNKSMYNSSGLGLTICKEVTSKINGEIWAESTVGEGSTFYVRLNNINPN